MTYQTKPDIFTESVAQFSLQTPSKGAKHGQEKLEVLFVRRLVVLNNP